MSSDFDEGSFPKVRGWLLAFSSSIIMLWFFGADLKSVSILGTSIDFTRNTEYVWLVAFVINAYLVLRFYQHQPDISYSTLPAYIKCYSSFMVKFMRLVSRRKIIGGVLDRTRVFPSSDFKGRVVKCVIESAEFKTYNQPPERRRYTRGLRQVVIFRARCLLDLKEGKTDTTRSYEVELDCPYLPICMCVWLSKFKVWITTSYATEHLLPYIWSGFAAVVCLVRWHAAANAVMEWCA